MEPKYAYFWIRNGRLIFLAIVSSEEEKDKIQREMREDGTFDQYVWYSLTRM